MLFKRKINNKPNHLTQLVESDSPDPSLLRVIHLSEKDYVDQGDGCTKQIAIYPPDKNAKSDSFFWDLQFYKLDKREVQFPKFPGYQCAVVLLPNASHRQSMLMNHQGEEVNTNLIFHPHIGSADISVEKLGKSEKRLLGAFYLIYVVDGDIQVQLDEHLHTTSPCPNVIPTRQAMRAGDTLLIERDEESSPSFMRIRTVSDQEALVIFVQLQEHMQKREPTVTTQDIAPSRRRHSLPRRHSLVPYGHTGEKPEELDINKMDLAPKDATLTEQLRTAPIPPSEEANRRDSLAFLTKNYDITQLYHPDTIPAIQIRTDLPEPVVRDRLVVEDFKEFSTSTVWIKMMMQGLGEWIRVPVIVLRGTKDGIHRVVSKIDVKQLKGTVVAVPCVNVVGYLKFQREFADGRDLNRQFPGKEDGYASQVYCHLLMQKLLSQFNYMIDLHTASFGRINSYYVRADMNDPATAHMAKLQKPQVILHNSGQDGTMRSAAAAKNIKAITVEIGNPQLFQDQYITWAYLGVMRILDHLEMYSLDLIDQTETDDHGPTNTIVCSSGFWVYTRTGGILEVYPGVNTIVKKGDLIARIKNMFGSVIEDYHAPCTSVVIGRSSNPVAMTGDRIVHLGVIKKKGESLSKVAKENY
ncbi:hypothetical protein DM01DRAFT_1364796 [Hesseltinella vesiculosa]|uniref:Succinylglutamate desuccinylase/Aspartoacylase catalytic domain-containing protein n=1 Tax=Hesseltinella vesiculosa TaxID=101127 RepID=A0A1X2G3V5_9FUNG|nr:hypothetical protein DM01DRAFT_1364796 [Hesseltinella vesiculosa]